ncbi:unnamed protein product [Vitrella brassicaformis CCMP3155]|uniref:Uncharacterized protein n=2 Tax=Vitrella brassicaformis TaxID=1169539 RepID=A0A0G4FJS0_VITBC|nr:unnamed protein product [Vitrella brassicaformis CCMP3155]|mmetsp:Transcript_27653/g.79572  ORF Transcript_27653/g.79572 Transcript_27653/m.79572 type:complete len:234 (+) Transcript_27653:100-801(+)|eukprot:CEM14012.1 unnamed protein product [Vitrella brassicaformis CCMP3155]
MCFLRTPTPAELAQQAGIVRAPDGSIHCVQGQIDPASLHPSILECLTSLSAVTGTTQAPPPTPLDTWAPLSLPKPSISPLTPSPPSPSPSSLFASSLPSLTPIMEEDEAISTDDESMRDCRHTRGTKHPLQLSVCDDRRPLKKMAVSRQLAQQMELEREVDNFFVTTKASKMDVDAAAGGGVGDGGSGGEGDVFCVNSLCDFAFGEGRGGMMQMASGGAAARLHQHDTYWCEF